MTDDGAKRRAILIANQDYPAESGFTTLRCPLRDAQAVHDVIADPAHGNFDHVTILENRSRSDIMIALKDALDDADRNDLMLIYFSGHGQVDEEGALYLAACDTRKHHLEATGIPSQAISDLIRRSRVSKKALVLDCCYAGAFTKNWKSGDSIIADRMQEFARGSGTYVLMATGDMSLAEEDPETGLSILTRYLVDGLRGKADTDRDGIVTINDLSRYIYKQVSRFHTQRPTEGGLDIQGDVAISKSGIDTEAEQREEARKKLLEWVAADGITPDIFAEASKILTGGNTRLSVSQRRRHAILMQIASGKMNLGQFHAEWFSAPANQPTMIRPMPRPEQTPPAKPAPPSATNAAPDKPTLSPWAMLVGTGFTAVLHACIIAIAASILSGILAILTEGRAAVVETLGPSAIGVATAIGLWRWSTMRRSQEPLAVTFGPAFGPPFAALIVVLGIMLGTGFLINF